MSTKPGSIALLGLAAILSNPVSAATDPVRHTPWLTSWYAAPQPGWDASFLLPMNVPTVLNNQTVREHLRLSAGGNRLRLVFSNRYGHEAVKIGEVRVRFGEGPEQSRTLTFSGAASASILPGAVLTSDPVVVAVPPLARLAITTYLPEPTPVNNFHWGAQQTLQLAAGNAAATSPFPAQSAFGGRLFLNAVMVDAPAGRHSVVVLGDSITDGNGSTPDADRRWPDFLAQRLAPHGIAVVNAGISGARLLKDGMGQNALARFEQDVLSQPGVSEVIVLLGINDIGWPGSPFAPSERAVTLDELTAGYRQLLAAARSRGLRVTVGTLPPFEGALEGTPYAGHYSAAKERMRVRLNDWLRTSGQFDAVVDFDAVLRDPAHPQRMRAEFDSGDHLHPGDAGYRAMAAAVDIAPMVGRVRPDVREREAAR